MSLAPYLAGFRFGFLEFFRDRREAVGSLMIFSLLLVLFYHIFIIMPMEAFGVPGLTITHYFWYFIVTEAVLIGTSLEAFGKQIGEGQLSGLLQRPTNMALFFIAKETGLHLSTTLFLLLFAIVVAPLFGDMPFYLEPRFWPVFLLQIFLSSVLFEMMTYVLGSTELLGPYSKPFSWIAAKFVFSFGGLFLPVSYFPPLLKSIAVWTPFPATIFSPAAIMLPGGEQTLFLELGRQLIWLAIFGTTVFLLDRKTTAYVTQRGIE